MADNVNITEGTGKTIAADDVGGAMYQRVKIAHGVDGSATDVSSSDPLPVVALTLPTNAATETSLAQVQTNTLASSTALGLKTDNKSTATDTTSVSIVSILKQISASIQAAAASLAGTLTVAAHNVTNAGTFLVQATIADAAHVTFGAKTDAKSTSTDATSITGMQVWKQISASVQAIATSVAGTLTVATHAVTQSGTWTVQPGNTANTTAWKVDGSAVTQPISAASLPSHPVTNAGTFAVQNTPFQVSTATLTSLASAATSAQLLASTAGRRGLMLVNTDANAALVKYGTTASSTSYTVRLPLNSYWEMPQPIYTGRIDVIWEADGAGSILATELT